MVNAGRADVTILPDGWTTVTRDRAPSAQFEHSMGVTQDGVEVFTLGERPSGSRIDPWFRAARVEAGRERARHLAPELLIGDDVR